MPAKKCQWCSQPFESAHPSKLFCSKAHKDEFGNFMAARGKSLLPIALAWRTMRGRKGVGASALKEMTEMLDKIAAELAAQGSQPMSKHFEATRRGGTGISNWKDFDRTRKTRIDKSSQPAQ